MSLRRDEPSAVPRLACGRDSAVHGAAPARARALPLRPLARLALLRAPGAPPAATILSASRATVP